jgi:hypothetical protein
MGVTRQELTGTAHVSATYKAQAIFISEILISRVFQQKIGTFEQARTPSLA